MEHLEAEKLVKKYRKHFLCDLTSPSLAKVEYKRNDIEKIIPHRDPILFIDTTTGIDLENKIITGNRKIKTDDPVFKGHFPSEPIYPGLLQVETIGQLALCFYPFFKHNTILLMENPGLNVRIVRLHHVLFQHIVQPGDDLLLIAKLIDYDDFIFRGIGQVISREKVCTIVIGEFYLFD